MTKRRGVRTMAAAAAGCLLALAFGFAAGRASAQAAGTLTAQGDALYDQRADLARAAEALAKYQEALAAGEDGYEAYWRMARVGYWIGDHAAKKDEKRRTFELAIYHAKKAVALAPGRPEGHYWLGVNYGVYGEAKGVLKSLSLVKPIKEEMAKVLAIDPAFEFGGADQLLGRLYYELPGLFGGSKDKSLEHLLKSRELGPRVGLTRIYLADTYLAMDQVEKARAELESVLTLEPEPKLIPETAQEKEMARKKLADKPFKKS